MPPPRPAPFFSAAWSRPAAQAGLLLAWLALAVYFHSPVREAMAPTLDGSNYGSYTYFTARNFQYGTEVVPMAGPYGFILYGWTYTGELFGVRTAGELLLNGALAALTLWFFRLMRGTRWRWLWLAAHLVCTVFLEDLALEWILLLGGFYLLLAPTESRAGWRGWLVTAVLALVSLIKGTQLALGLATLGVVLGALGWQRQGRQAARLATAYCAALLGWWLLAGQHPLHLPAYVRGVLELGGGYTDAMSIPTPPAVLHRGLLVSAALAAGLAWALAAARRDAARAAAVLLLAGHAFVQWKHAMVRADGHAYIYFHFATVAAGAAYFLGQSEASGRLRSWTGAAILLTILVGASAGRDEPALPRWFDAPAEVARRLVQHGRHLLTLGDTRRALERKLATEQLAHVLPRVRATVGARPIDGFSFEQGLLPLNGLNYRPRPMGGGTFNVYTPYLMKLNGDFIADPVRRPDFYLYKPQMLDHRFIAQDDGLALLALLQHYRPLLLEHEHLLLRANDAAPAGSTPRLLARATIRLGEPVEVPAAGEDEILLVRLDLRPSFSGRLRAALYKPAPVLAEVQTSDGAVRLRRLIPTMARSPFILSPVIEAPADFVRLYGRTPQPRVTRFTLNTDAPAGFARDIAVEFYAAPRPAPLAAEALAALEKNLRFPFGSAEPEAITPAFRTDSSARFLHAPAEAVWPLTGEERSFAFHYGIDPHAYEDGTTNGVDFIVELRGPSGGVRPIWHRLLQPKAVAADRGRQTMRLPLPIYAPGSKLVLRTDPGEFGDNAWDWAYVANLELAPGAFAPGQFPDFHPLPTKATGENIGVAELEGRPVTVLHVPGEAAFVLGGSERQLAFDFGFLPGAYTNGGDTPGADFVVELTRAGQPAREIFRRRLQPVGHTADRGGQSASIPLPATQPGDVLTLRTLPAPGGGASWGWTYIGRLVIE